MSSSKRILREFQLLTGKGYDIKLVDDSLVKWIVAKKGPEDSPYASGTFQVNVEFSDDYPFKAPTIHFKTQIYHPNIELGTGHICLDVLRDKWSATLTIEKVVEIIWLLLTTPNANSPMFPEAATLYQTDMNSYNAKAKEWTLLYAF